MVDMNDPSEISFEVPVFRCWWSSTKQGCSKVDPNSSMLDFNEFGWLYMGGLVMIVFTVLGLSFGICKAMTPKPKNNKTSHV